MKINDKTLIEKGWSEDKKYCITTQDNQKFLMRISSIDLQERKKKEFEIMKQISELNIPMCQPIEFGISKEGVYSIQSWIEGTDAENIIPSLPLQEQYSYGFEAGKILKKIHQIPSPSDTEDWSHFFNRKLDRKLNMYEECTIKYKKGQIFIDCIQSHRHLLKSRPSTLQHGDYHIGNMMIDSNKKLTIIDFNRFDYGDPWEEFNRIVWCAQKAPFFAKGIIDGYFNKDVPMEFWQLLTLYISSNTLGSLPWAIPFGEKQIEIMMNQTEEILEWFDDLKDPIPNWYKQETPI